jgi:hypothetical protein
MPYEDDNVSDVKFSRVGMKVVKVENQQEGSIYDPNEQYDEKASRYTANLPVER